MTWRERRERASFRGVEFHTQTNTGTIAPRRVSVRKFAGRDGSEQQDHGADPSEFDVVAFLAGDDYDLRRNELEAALGEEGPGALVLPLRGDLWARVIRGPITTESKDEGGYCSLRFTVVIEDRRAGSLRVSEDTREALKGSATTLRAAAGSDLTETVKTKGLPAQYLLKGASAVQNFTAKLATIQTATQGLLSPVTALTAQLNQLNSVANSILSTPSLFVTTGLALVNAAMGIGLTVLTAIDRATGLPKVVADNFARGRMARLADSAAGAVRGFRSSATAEDASPAAQQAQANSDAVDRYLRSTVLAAQAEVFASADFDSATFALGAMDRVLAEIDDLVLLSPTDAHYLALIDLRARLTTHLVETASRLPETLRYAPPRATPVLLLAWELYGDARMESDIVGRNRIPAPLFCAEPVEVLAP